MVDEWNRRVAADDFPEARLRSIVTAETVGGLIRNRYGGSHTRATIFEFESIVHVESLGKFARMAVAQLQLPGAVRLL